MQIYSRSQTLLTISSHYVRPSQKGRAHCNKCVLHTWRKGKDRLIIARIQQYINDVLMMMMHLNNFLNGISKWNKSNISAFSSFGISNGKYIIGCLGRTTWMHKHRFAGNLSFMPGQVHAFEVWTPTSIYHQFIISTCYICWNFISCKVLSSVIISCNFIYNASMWVILKQCTPTLKIVHGLLPDNKQSVHICQFSCRAHAFTCQSAGPTWDISKSLKATR